MKLTLTNQKWKAMLTIGIAAGLLCAQPAVAIGKPFKKYSVTSNEPNEEKPAKKNKAKFKAKTFASLNNSSVKIYPDVLKREMHVVAKDNDGKDIEFFVFDLEGTLLHQYKMKAKDHNKISNLKRGTYLFRVFSNDEETAAGKFEIR